MNNIDEFSKFLSDIYNNGKVDVRYFNRSQQGEIFELDPGTNKVRHLYRDFNNGIISEDVVPYEEFFMARFGDSITFTRNLISSLDPKDNADLKVLINYYSIASSYNTKFRDIVLDQDGGDQMKRLIIEGINNHLFIIINYIALKLEKSKEFHNIEDNLSTTNEKIKLALNTDEIGCFIRLMKEAALIEESNTHLISRVVSRSFSSKNKPDFTWETIKNAMTDCMAKSDPKKDLLKRIDKEYLTNMRLKIRSITEK